MSTDGLAPIPSAEEVDELSVYRYVLAMLGNPIVKVEVRQAEQLREFLTIGLELYSKYRPTLRYFSLECYAGVQHYRPLRHTIGQGVVEVLVPRIDPIAPLLLSSGSRVDIFGYRYCLAGDTSISLLDGRERTIEQIIEEYGDGQFWVYSVDENGEVVPGYAHSARKTGTQEKVVKVTLDNGESVVVTPAHKFVMRDGSEKPAGSLEPGDSLMPLYRDWRPLNPAMPKYTYESCRAAGGWSFTHRIVADAAVGDKQCPLCGASLPDEAHTVRHHVNFKKHDNRPENLQWVTPREHEELHSHLARLWDNPEFRAKVTELSRARMQARWDNDAGWREDASARAKKQWADPEYRTEKIAAIIERHKNDPEFQAIRDKAASDTLKKLWANAAWREAKAKTQSAMMKGKWLDEEWRTTNGQIVLAALEEARKRPEYEQKYRDLMVARNTQRWATDAAYRERMTTAARDHLLRLWDDPEFRMRVTIASSQRMAKLWEDPEFRERHRERLIERWRDPQYREQQTAAISDAAVESWQDDAVRARRQAGMQEAWSGERGKRKRKAAADNATKRWADPEFKRQAAEKMTIGRVRSAHVKKNHAGEFDQCATCKAEIEKRLAAKAEPTNHKVVSVEDAGFADVYNLVVEEHHKFGLTAGIFVCQSYPYRDISELYIDYFYFAEAKRVLSAEFQWKWLDGGIAIHPRPDEPFPLTYVSAFDQDILSFPKEDLHWLKNYVLALAEQAVGNARGKFPIIGGAQAMQQTDGMAMVQRGYARQEKLELEVVNLGLRFPIMGS